MTRVHAERRLTSTTSIKLTNGTPGSSTPTSTNTHNAQHRSRLSRQIHPPRPADDDDIDMDAEGEDDLDGDGEVEDERLYCFCQKQSYGDVRCGFVCRFIGEMTNCLVFVADDCMR